MKAAQIVQFGPPSVITNNDLRQPEPGTGQLLVRVKAAGVGTLPYHSQWKLKIITMLRYNFHDRENMQGVTRCFLQVVFGPSFKFECHIPPISPYTPEPSRDRILRRASKICFL